MKRTIALLSVLLLCVQGFSQKVTVDGITYKIENGEAWVSKTDRELTHVIIPDSVNCKGTNYPVVYIYGFFRHRKLQSISLPPTTKKICNNAFFYCTELKSISIPNSVESIDFDAFLHCKNLRTIIFPDHPIEIHKWAFKDGAKNNAPLAITDVRCHNGTIPTYALPFLHPECAFMLAYKAGQIQDAKGQLAQAQPANISNGGNGSTAEKTVSIPTVPTSDVDAIPDGTANNNSNTFAVIFANEHYRREASVDFALRDGQVFQQYCQAVLGMPATNVHLVEDATLNDFHAEIDWLTKVCQAYGSDANIIIYYAGHGIPNEQDQSAYLLPTDGIGSNVNTAYSLSKLYATLGELEAAHVTVFLDACFSGAKRGEGMLASARGVAIKPRPATPRGQLVVFSAASGDETAYPYAENGHGLFTYFLLKKLKESAGRCTLGELSDYITTQVTRRSIVVNNKSQTPTVVPSQAMKENWRAMKLR